MTREQALRHAIDNIYQTHQRQADAEAGRYKRMLARLKEEEVGPPIVLLRAFQTGELRPYEPSPLPGKGLAVTVSQDGGCFTITHGNLRGVLRYDQENVRDGDVAGAGRARAWFMTEIAEPRGWRVTWEGP